MTYSRDERFFSAASSYDGRDRSESSRSTYYKTPSWASLSFAESNRRLTPLESGASVALENQFCGWLWMRGHKLGRWRHRYFCLNGSILTYFITFPSEEFLKQTSQDHFLVSDGTQPRGVLRVAHVKESESCRLGFKLYGTCGKILDIRAHKVDERNEWLRALKTPARRKSRAWSAGSAEELTMSLASFDSDLVCTFDRQSLPIEKAGWMHKKSDVLRRWNKYFFVVQGKMLSYYASDKPYEVPRRRGYIQNVQVVRSSANNQEQELQIRLDSQSQVLHVRLSCQEELEEWREALLTNIPFRETRATSST